ncbi:MAG: sulfatase [Planctomycetota bacterium]
MALRRLVFFALPILLAACSGEAEREAGPAAAPTASRPPNVLLVSIDTLRADHLGCYGYPRATSPSIDALAARGVTFERAYSHSSKTAISHMSIMTGLLPESHGVEQWKRGNVHRLSDAIPTMATLLQQRGYRTAGIADGGNVSGKLGFDQGMDEYRQIGDVADTFAAAGDWIEASVRADTRKPFFLFVHTYEVHDPYTPRVPFQAMFTAPDYDGAIIGSESELQEKVGGAKWQQLHNLFWKLVKKDEPADVQHLKDLYDGSIRLTDEHIGKLFARLDTLGVTGDTLIVILSDHGEEFLEHTQFGHEQIYDELLHVPFVAAFPASSSAQWRGRRVKPLVRMIDVLPTVLDVVGIATPTHVQGRSLVPLIDSDGGGGAPPEEVASSWREAGWQAFRHGEWKIVRRTQGSTVEREELFHLARDPGELTNLWTSDAGKASELDRLLSTRTTEAEALRARLGGSGTKVAPDASTIEKLQGLGYLGDDEGE